MVLTVIEILQIGHFDKDNAHSVFWIDSTSISKFSERFNFKPFTVPGIYWIDNLETFSAI